MASIFKSHIAAMSAYAPPLDGRDPKSHLLLDFNEKTLPISAPIEQALVDYIRSGRLQMYPAYGDIAEKIAAYCGVASEQVMITNGSDQGIDLIIRSACVEGDQAIIPSPAFAMYTQVAKVEKLDIVQPSLTFEDGFPLVSVLAAITDKTKVICIANPNNPSGTLISRQDIVAVLEAAPRAAVLVDECYFEYTQHSVCDLVGQYNNLIVTRTFSKTWGIPSLRFGYVIASSDNIKALLNVRGPYDINQLAVVAVQAALANPSSMQGYVDEVMQESKPLLEAFLDKHGIRYWPSMANFIWAFPENPEHWRERLSQEGILVRPKKDDLGCLGLRITVGSMEQTSRLVSVLAPLLHD